MLLKTLYELTLILLSSFYIGFFTHSLYWPQFDSLIISYITCLRLKISTYFAWLNASSFYSSHLNSYLSQLSLTSLTGTNFSGMQFHSMFQLFSIALVIYLIFAFRSQVYKAEILILLIIVFLLSSTDLAASRHSYI